MLSSVAEESNNGLGDCGAFGVLVGVALAIGVADEIGVALGFGGVGFQGVPAGC